MSHPVRVRGSSMLNRCAARNATPCRHFHNGRFCGVGSGTSGVTSYRRETCSAENLTESDSIGFVLMSDLYLAHYIWPAARGNVPRMNGTMQQSGRER